MVEHFLGKEEVASSTLVAGSGYFILGGKNRIIASCKEYAMGIEYYLVNKENKTFYELGKHCYFDTLDYLWDPEYLEEYIYADVFYCYEKEDEGRPHLSREYCREIAQEIYEFVKGCNPENIVFISDCCDDTLIIRCLGFRCVGSRYRCDNDPNYNAECIKWANRHLEDTPFTRRVYNLETAKSFGHLAEEFMKMKT